MSLPVDGSSRSSPSSRSWVRGSAPRSLEGPAPSTPAPAPRGPADGVDAPRKSFTAFTGLQDRALIDAVRIRSGPTRVLGYDQARVALFTAVDNQGGRVRCVYT